jgi:hypothetical protein
MKLPDSFEKTVILYASASNVPNNVKEEVIEKIFPYYHETFGDGMLSFTIDLFTSTKFPLTAEYLKQFNLEKVLI